jgi:glycerol-3-phosphate dehydrogenase (NAD(P)+)
LPHVNIIGGGSWGLSFANLLRDNQLSVAVWEYNPVFVQELQHKRTNSKLLPGIVLDEEISFTNSLSKLFSFEADILVFAVPSHTLRSVSAQVTKVIKPESNFKAIVNLAKGIEQETMLRMSDVLAQELPERLGRVISTLSGPSHAEEVARKIPTAVVLAGQDNESLAYSQMLFSNQYFRVYTSNDLIGVELGGAVKNIIAIAAGIVEGLELGDNTRGALITRGLAEIRRLGERLNADANTFNGLSGIGDLITTAFSKHSRNRYVGYHLGKGEKLESILESMTMIAEGVKTTKSIYQLKEKLQVTMPITDEIYQVIFMNKSPQQAIIDLMTRELKEED